MNTWAPQVDVCTPITGPQGVVVTGAGGGIGRAVAHRLAADGFREVVKTLTQPPPGQWEIR